MRVSSVQFQLTGIGSILEQQARLSKLQQQLGTGRRILTPADDPAGAAQVLELSAKISDLAQLRKNGEMAQTRLVMEESTLTQVGNSLQRVRELMLKANNDSTTAADRRLIAAEMRQLQDGLVQLANAGDGNGEYLFGGTASRAAPFAVVDGAVHYLGDQAERLVQVGPDRQLAVNHNGFDVFMKIPQGNGSFVARADAGNQGSGVIDNGRPLGGAMPAAGYSLTFSPDGSQYQVDGALPWIDYAEGEPIAVAGAVQVTISGSPAGGDVFTLARSTPQSVFGIVDEMADVLAAAADTASSRTGVHNTVNRLLSGIDHAQESILESRAEVGARLGAIEAEANTSADAAVELESARSSIQDLDYAKAISDFSLQMAGLQAAQLSYTKIQGLSLFNFL